ncbi:MBL fold metallo-hydrolase [Citreicella sp. C3M06]|uniref:MBL fold metallo-hydrolase n=1 Tax=Citreicella sp. C3M06 TaxID=2841564 RepID=UPI001C08F544|nr:MBL fold metallo-hydrolase [Citreicella sp. C3M06]MBU2959420.1 MBL fold metallo-hydrolase [Citreicella sp. C3M06]
MNTGFKISRRAALTGAAALPLAAGLGSGAAAQVAQKGGQMPRVNRVMLGDFEVTALMAGTATREAPHEIFGLNVDDATFEEVSAEANIPTDKAQFFFTPTLVNTGAELILFDTGLNPEGIVAAVEAAGYSADEVTHMVITHMHGDHVGGLTDGNGPTFANAQHVTGQAEFDYWKGTDNATFAGKVAPLADRFSFVGDGAAVASGVTAMLTPGHTPGHMGYMLESGGKQLMLFADVANHYVWSLAYPDWEVSFDTDKAEAAATRRKVLDMLATDKVPFIGYHMPFPALGYAETRGEGFHYVPHSYQLML